MGITTHNFKLPEVPALKWVMPCRAPYGSGVGRSRQESSLQPGQAPVLPTRRKTSTRSRGKSQSTANPPSEEDVIEKKSY